VSELEEQEEVLTWPNGEVVDVASIEAYAEDARRVADSSLHAEAIRTPDWVIDELAVVSKEAAKMLVVILNAETHKRRCATKLERAKAKARWEHRNLPATLVPARVVLDTTAEKDEYDLAVAAFEFARRVGNLLKDYTSRVQTIGKQVEITYRHESAS
jgi:hypothetical protein